MIPKPIATAILVLVTVVWAANFGAQFFLPDYRPDVSINGIFMALVGGALVLGRPKKPDAAAPDGPAPVPVPAPPLPPPPEPPAPPEPAEVPDVLPPGKESFGAMLQRLAAEDKARGEQQ